MASTWEAAYPVGPEVNFMSFCAAILPWLSYDDEDHVILPFFGEKVFFRYQLSPPNQMCPAGDMKKNLLYGLISSETFTHGFSTERTEDSVTCSTFTQSECRSVNKQGLDGCV